MKKILLASTALALSAGLANAQAVAWGGQGRMGLTLAAGTWSMEHRLRLNATVSVQADHGLSFGAYTRLQMSGTAAGTISASRVWVEANGLRLTFGNQDGAVVSTGMVGFTGIGYTGGSFNGNSAGIYVAPAAILTQFVSGGAMAAGTAAAVTYTMGNTNVALSREVGANAHTEIGVNHTAGAFTIAAGWSNGGAGMSTISGTYNGGSWAASLILARIAGVNNYSLGGRVALGGGNLAGYVGRVGGSQAYGLSYGYGLGGGATVAAGFESIAGATTGNVGVVFNF